MTETDDILKGAGVPEADILAMSEYQKTEMRRKIENFRRNHATYFRPANLATAE